LSLQGPVDFGNVVANSKVITKEISLYNHGSKEGEFRLRYSGHLPIAITPSGGKVPAHSVQIIKVCLASLTTGMWEFMECGNYRFMDAQI